MIVVLRIRGYHPLRPAFPDPSASTTITTGLFRFRSPLLAESPLMSVPPGTEMFQFPGFASPPYVFRWRYPIRVGCPIRTPRDQRPLAASPGFSQRATSFIASWRQGIHPMPFSCSFPRAPKGARLTQAPPCTGTIHRFHGKQPQATAKPSLSTHSNVLNAATGLTLGIRRRSRSPQHPGQTPRPTRHGPPLPARPKRLRIQTKPTESSRASKTHQNLIHNPQRTTRFRPQAPNPAQRQWSSL